MQVQISMIHWPTGVETVEHCCPLEDIIRDNEMSEDEIDDMIADLYLRNEHHIGGGASPHFVLRWL